MWCCPWAEEGRKADVKQVKFCFVLLGRFMLVKLELKVSQIRNFFYSCNIMYNAIETSERLVGSCF